MAARGRLRRRAGGGGVRRDEVVVDGSSTVFRISKAAQEALQPGQARRHRRGRQPRHRRRLQPLPPGRGRHRRRLARRPSPTRRRRPRRRGSTGPGSSSATTGSRVVVNPKNDFVKSLTVDAAQGALGARTARSRPGRTSTRPGPTGRSSCTAPTTTRARSSSSPRRSSARPRASATDVQASSDDNTLVNGVAGDADGSATSATPTTPPTRTSSAPSPIQNGPDAKAGRCRARRRSSTSRTRPLSRPLFIFVKNSALRRPEVAAFVKYYLDNVATLAEKAGYVAPTAEDIGGQPQGARPTGRAARRRAARPPAKPSRRAATRSTGEASP